MILGFQKMLFILNMEKKKNNYRRQKTLKKKLIGLKIEFE